MFFSISYEMVCNRYFRVIEKTSFGGWTHTQRCLRIEGENININNDFKALYRQ